MSLLSLLEESSQTPDLVTLEATVATGFEFLALNECKEKLGKSTKSLIARGRIFFNIPVVMMRTVEDLRSIDNFSVVIKHVPNLQLNGKSLNEVRTILESVVKTEDIKKAVTVWCKRNKFKGIVYPSKETYLAAKQSEIQLKASAKSLAECRIKSNTGIENKSVEKLEVDSIEQRTILNAAEFKAYHELDSRLPEDKVLKYRVTCTRNGKHIFTSQDAALYVGGSLQDMFSWMVDLNLFDMDIILNIRDDTLYYGIGMTKESKHRRNIVSFGPTTLRATICYNMLRLAEPKVGDIIIDPMCGGGSIPIEGLLAYPQCFFICGDIHEKAVTRTQVNLENPDINIRRSGVDAFSWDTTHLPLRESSVDIFITDLPFGKRSGSVYDNRTLYKLILVELARVVRCTSGKAVLLTYDKKSMSMALAYAAGLWKLGRKYKVNIGGLEASVFLLSRLNTPSSMPPPAPKGRHARKFKNKRHRTVTHSEGQADSNKLADTTSGASVMKL